ncbi:AbrB/MazE/SpoVT family DNA-binding domain-containing protein [Caldalkalibacillus mannanilyticus]|uniref:AbrB/MazE/SpoVT family DNA-binding domain-containing protein n=1 Tax=Caldalkalibacillus mannanilyticus TaxID=1418 RepID=UPI00046A90A5|nr:AbrB/MazE/SpoVT family DNA-binding domain-containing protein [Caldalkalibacillus mannanilyticus]
MVVRKVDGLGRIIIPHEVRKSRKIQIGDSLEFFTDKNVLVLKKHEASLPACVLCNTFENLTRVKISYICAECLEDIKAK